MGSKVSSKMAAPTVRVIQALRPHTPMIKFPNRQGVPKPNAQEALKTLTLPVHNVVSSPAGAAAAAAPSFSRPAVPLPTISGTPDSLTTVQQLPARYRRRPITTEEMDYIQRGGPE